MNSSNNMNEYLITRNVDISKLLLLIKSPMTVTCHGCNSKNICDNIYSSYQITGHEYGLSSVQQNPIIGYYIIWEYPVCQNCKDNIVPPNISISRVSSEFLLDMDECRVANESESEYIKVLCSISFWNEIIKSLDD